MVLKIRHYFLKQFIVFCFQFLVKECGYKWMRLLELVYGI